MPSCRVESHPFHPGVQKEKKERKKRKQMCSCMHWLEAADEYNVLNKDHAYVIFSIGTG